MATQNPQHEDFVDADGLGVFRGILSALAIYAVVGAVGAVVWCLV